MCIIAGVKNRNIIWLGVAVALFLIISCSGCTSLTKISDVITNPSARDVYAREFKDSKEVYLAWEAAYSSAVADSLTVAPPYGEKGTFIKNSNVAYSYNIVLQEGEVLVADVARDSASQRVFIDVLQKQGSNYTPVISSKVNEATVEYPIASTGIYKVVLQPEMAADTNFFISLTKKPLYAFPVAGKGNADIMSFWGMERDGGKRSHEGIDIFAKKGTPVVAITNGTISYTGERGLGGKQVWLRDGLFGKSLYYAHLDSITVQAGAAVKVGDTLGFVGNTGNAKFTPPHLHFGIYRSGAVNPLPYVYTINKINQSKFTRTCAGGTIMVKGKANLRQGPDTKTATVGALAQNDTIIVLGQHNDWLHIKTANGQTAFLHKSLVKEGK
jgi:murein DD-endopeptidase MepM/ murein hydrolase activator NlpD